MVETPTGSHSLRRDMMMSLGKLPESAGEVLWFDTKNYACSLKGQVTGPNKTHSLIRA